MIIPCLSLRPREADILRLCREAIHYRFKTVCVNPAYVRTACAALQGSPVGVCTDRLPWEPPPPRSRPLKPPKRYGGAAEIDMVINVGMLKSGHADYVKAEVAAVVEAAAGRTVKVILETGLLSEAEKLLACRLARRAAPIL